MKVHTAFEPLLKHTFNLVAVMNFVLFYRYVVLNLIWMVKKTFEIIYLSDRNSVVACNGKLQAINFSTPVYVNWLDYFTHTLLLIICETEVIFLAY